MIFKDLREFILRVESLDDLKRINGADPDVEIGAITELAAASPGCPMLLFDEIKGCKAGYRVVTNLFQTERRLATALGESPDLRGIKLVEKFRGVLKRLGDGPPPVGVKDGPVTENVVTGENVDLFELVPVRWHELDSGPFFSAGATITKDPDSNWINVGIYRQQILDRSTLTLNIDPGKHGRLIAQKYWDQGRSCPVAVSLGHMPALSLAATFVTAPGVSEYDVAGQLNGAPIEVVVREPTGLPIPATSEAVLEGEALPPEVESRIEGSWGEGMGYYKTEPVMKPVIKVKTILHRNSPIIQGSPPMRPFPGMRHFAVNARCATMLNDLEKCGIPDIMGVWEYSYGFFVISLRQRYAGHAKQAGLIACGSRASLTSRFIVLVDEDINPCNINEVVWALTTRCDPECGIEILRECWSAANDPIMSAEKKTRSDLTTGRVIINACKPLYRGEALPPVVAVSPELKARVIEKWGTF